MILNPVLPGFHPDPSILRVGDDYYLATSTFEWYPGVRVHHSRDLVHWRPLGGILTSRRSLDLSGVPDSGGVWAPDLTYANGLFHLVYGVMDNYAFGFKDITNYLITAPSVDGPWSDPVRLPGRGFDASLYHEDGHSWLLNMVLDSRPGRGFAGIELQPLSGGKPALILPNRFVTEGPHLYKIDGWYYLMVAEGGTGYEHGVTVLRSREMAGPYEEDPAGPMLTSRHDPSLELQKAGHGRTASGIWPTWRLARTRDAGACSAGRRRCSGWSGWTAGRASPGACRRSRCLRPTCRLIRGRRLPPTGAPSAAPPPPTGCASRLTISPSWAVSPRTASAARRWSPAG